MPTSVSKTPLFTGSNPVRFSDLSSTFKDGSQKDIKFSDYKRVIDREDTNPVVPDATENEGISATDNNLKISGYRGSIKRYDLTQTGTNAALDLGSNAIWNGNLNRNIIKSAKIEGICHATSTANYGLKLEAETYNLDVDISGQIYGQGGTPPNGNGGGALYIRNLTTRSAKSSIINVSLNSTAKVWAGGGSGRPGNPGFAGPLLYCWYNSNYSRSVSTGGGGSRGCPDWSCNSGGSASGCNPNDVRARCRGASPRRGESGYVCAGNWTLNCSISSYYNAQGSGGSGGLGGPGRGWSNFNTTLVGTAGNSGNSASCSGGTSTGNSGNPGFAGGEWGEDSVGKKGPAITGNPSYYKIRGDSTTNFKGSIRNI